MRIKYHFSPLVLILLAGFAAGVLVSSVSAESDGARVIWVSSNGQGRALAVGYSPDGRSLAVGSSLGIHLYNSSDLQPIRFIPAETWVRALAYSPDGSLLASGSYDPIVRLWRASDGTLLKELSGHTAWVRDLAFSPGGELLATASDDNTVRLWSIPDGHLILNLDKGTEGVRAVAFSPDGTILATGGYDKIIRLWNASDGTLLRELKGHKDWVRALAFSLDGEWLASGGFDATVRLWRVADGELLVTRKEHTSSVLGLAFSPDGELLASASVDTSVRLWKMPGVEAYDLLRGHTDFVFSVAFSPDGQTLTSGAVDNTVRVWDVPAEANPAAQERVSSPSNCKACHHPRGNYLEPAGLSQPPRVLEAGCATCHPGDTLVLHWCPAFPRTPGPLTPPVVSLVTSDKIGVSRGNQELNVAIATLGNGEHFYSPSIIVTLPVAGQVYYAGEDATDIEVHLEVWSGLEKVATLITRPHSDGYFYFNTFIGKHDTQLKRPIEQRTCIICHNENLEGKLLIPPGEIHILVTAKAPDGNQASDERWIVVDQSHSGALAVHVELEGNDQPVPGLQVQASTRLYEWQGRTFTSVTDTSGVAYLQVEALSEAPTHYTFQVPPTVVDGVLYESTEPIEVTLLPGATTAPVVTLQVQAAHGGIYGHVTSLNTPVQVWAVSLPDGSATAASTSSQGAFSFANLRVGQYLLLADPQALAGQGLALEAESIDLSHAPSAQIDLIPQSLEGTSLAGNITDEDGASLPFAWVNVAAQTGLTDPASGAYALFGLPAEKATAILSAPGYYSQAHYINIPAAAASSMSLSLVRRPETLLIPWGDGAIVIPPETVARVEGQNIIFEQGWLWGKGEPEGPLVIQWEDMQITIPDGQFALERLPARSGWLYVMDGQAYIQRGAAAESVTVQAGEMVLLNREQVPHPVQYDPVVVGALRLNGEVPIQPAWQPSLGAQIRDRLAQIGIGTAQIVTLVTYLMAFVFLLVMPILAANRYLKNKRERKT